MIRTLYIIIFVGLLLGNVSAQPANKNKHQPAKAAPFFDEADAMFGKRKARTKAHGKYANQEVSYRQSQRRKNRAGKIKVSQVTHDAEFESWANKKR